MTAAEIAATKKKRTFRKFTYRGVDLDQLLDMNYEQLMGLVHARARRRFSRGGYWVHDVNYDNVFDVKRLLHVQV